MKDNLFPISIRIRCEPELRDALAARAKAEKTTVSEVTRRLLRQATLPQGERQ